jgi:threonine synthase
VPYRCPVCNGLFDFMESEPFVPSSQSIAAPGLWRYRDFFHLPRHAPTLYLGEGSTPLVTDMIDGASVAFKLESHNPTGSYKDRGTATLVSFLISRGVTAAVEDSSGNAGASFAAYAARAGLQARVFVPESASGPKLNQIVHYGAELMPVAGPRSQAAAAVLEEVNAGAVYASHAFLPFGLPGIATIAFEIYDQLGGRFPGSVIAPAGHGALLLGVLRGFQALVDARLGDALPFMVGVQAAACAPLSAAFAGGLEAMQAVQEGATLAEGVRVRWPARVDALLAELPPATSRMISIPEDEIAPAFHALARRGTYAEPTSALAYAALRQLIGAIPEPIVVILSGFGLKLGTKI